MKKNLHPENYRPVVFKDMSNGDMFLTKSTCQAAHTHSIQVRASSLIQQVVLTAS